MRSAIVIVLLGLVLLSCIESAPIELRLGKATGPIDASTTEGDPSAGFLTHAGDGTGNLVRHAALFKWANYAFYDERAGWFYALDIEGQGTGKIFDLSGWTKANFDDPSYAPAAAYTLGVTATSWYVDRIGGQRLGNYWVWPDFITDSLKTYDITDPTLGGSTFKEPTLVSDIPKVWQAQTIVVTDTYILTAMANLANCVPEAVAKSTLILFQYTKATGVVGNNKTFEIPEATAGDCANDISGSTVTGMSLYGTKLYIAMASEGVLVYELSADPWANWPPTKLAFSDYFPGIQADYTTGAWDMCLTPITEPGPFAYQTVEDDFSATLSESHLVGSTVPRTKIVPSEELWSCGSFGAKGVASSAKSGIVLYDASNSLAEVKKYASACPILNFAGYHAAADRVMWGHGRMSLCNCNNKATEPCPLGIEFATTKAASVPARDILRGVFGNYLLDGRDFLESPDTAAIGTLTDFTAEIAFNGKEQTPEELQLCDDTKVTADFNGKIALIFRGSCPFFQKIATAIAKGAKAVLMANRPNSGNFFMSVDQSAQAVPAVVIDYTTGMLLVNLSLSECLQDSDCTGANKKCVNTLAAPNADYKCQAATPVPTPAPTTVEAAGSAGPSSLLVASALGLAFALGRHGAAL